MAVQTLSNVKLWAGGYDLSAYASECAIDWSRDPVDKTAFGATARARMAGLQSVAFSHAGFYESGTTGQVETVLSSNQGVSNVPITVAPTGGSAGALAYLFRATQGELTPFGGSVGEANKYRLSCSGEDSPLVHGQIMHNGTLTTNGNSPVWLLSAVGAGQSLYVGVHVLAISGAGAALRVRPNSDDNVGFTSGAVQGDTGNLTAVGSAWLAIPGPITDAYWLSEHIITGTSPSVTFVVSFGIA